MNSRRPIGRVQTFDSSKFHSVTITNPNPVIGSDRTIEFVLPKRYVDIHFINAGAQGIVVSAMDTVNEGKVAIKKMHRPFVLPIAAKRTYREIALLASVRHPNIISLYSTYTPQQKMEDFHEVYLVMEYMSATLYTLERPGMSILPHRSLSFLVYQMLCAVNHMHRMGIIHRDLKPENIVVNESCVLKVLDFGLARLSATDNAMRMTGYVVTRYYRAPEIILGIGYCEKADVWSIGCILAELINRRILFKGENHIDQWMKVVDVRGTPSDKFIQSLGSSTASYVRHLPRREPKSMEEILPENHFLPNSGAPGAPDQNSAQARDLVNRMLTYEAGDRISVQEALEHPYVKQWSRDDEVHTPLTSSRYDQNLDMKDYTLEQWKELLFNEVKLFEDQNDIFGRSTSV